MSTVLRLPHMDIVLECDHKVRRGRRSGHSEKLSPRRSDRLRNVSGENQDHQQTEANVRCKRRRYNSVMDDQEDQEENDNHEEDDQDRGDKQRQEPEHRQQNRMKMQRQKVSDE